MSTITLDHVEVEQEALEQAKRYFNVKSNIEAIRKMVDWFRYAQEVNETMEHIAGKGRIESVYE